MNYKVVKINCNVDLQEILIAELSQYNYESFEESETELKAYIPEALFEESLIKDLAQQYAFTFEIETIIEQNWNAVWESNFQPIIIADKCVVRSPFHQVEKKYPYEIIIQPKMSFGTGHHETTTLMIENQLEIPHKEKKVLDVGCGTGILAIMALKLHAKNIDAIDIDDWAVNNAQENLKQNDATLIQVKKGSIFDISSSQKYEIILANINRNVLMQEIPEYKLRLASGAYLVLSGFYEQDIKLIVELTQKEALQLKAQKTRNQWSSLVFQKT